MQPIDPDERHITDSDQIEGMVRMADGRIGGRLFKWLGVASIALVVGCAQSDDTQSSHASASRHVDDAASHANSDVDDYLPGAGLERLTTASDLVVHGQVVSAESGVSIADDPSAKYTVFTVLVTEVIKGEVAQAVDVAMLTELEGAPFVPAGRITPEPGVDGVWMLTKIAPEFGREGYVLTNHSGLLITQDDGGILSGGGEESAVSSEVEELRNTNNLLDFLRAVEER